MNVPSADIIDLLDQIAALNLLLDQCQMALAELTYEVGYMPSGMEVRDELRASYQRALLLLGQLAKRKYRRG